MGLFVTPELHQGLAKEEHALAGPVVVGVLCQEGLEFLDREFPPLLGVVARRHRVLIVGLVGAMALHNGFDFARRFHAPRLPRGREFLRDMMPRPGDLGEQAVP